MGLFNNKHDDEVPQQDLQELFQRLEHLERKCRRLEKRVEELENVRITTSLQPTSLQPTPSPSQGEGGLVTPFKENVNIKTNQAPLPSGGAGGGLQETLEVQGGGPSSSSFYLPAPTSDGLFMQASEHEQIGKSIYQLTTHDGLNGSFILLDTPDAIATAMISVSTFVKPVCRVSGPTAQFPRHIVTEEEGTATREGTAWRVVRKAVVRFE